MAVRGPQQFRDEYRWGPWEQYVPAWTAASVNPSLGNGSIGGKFRREGSTGYLRGFIKAGSTTTFGSGWWSIGLPTGWTASNAFATYGYQVDDCLLNPTGGTARSGYVWAVPGSAALLVVTGDATPLAVTATVPATWNSSGWMSWGVVTLELD